MGDALGIRPAALVRDEGVPLRTIIAQYSHAYVVALVYD
jgi:hypothetical protein